jgi:uncharacterized protein (DUF885 family)
MDNVMENFIKNIISIICTGLVCYCASICSVNAASPDEEVKDLADQAWQRLLETSLFYHMQENLPITELPDLSREQFDSDVAFARRMIGQLDKVQIDKLSPSSAIMHGVLHHEMSMTVASEKYYWLDFFYTQYQAVYAFVDPHEVLTAIEFDRPREPSRYLKLVDEYAATIDQLLTHAREQVRRNIYLPKAAVDGVRGMYKSFSAGAVANLGVDRYRLDSLPKSEADEFLVTLTRKIDTKVIPAFDALVTYFGTEYSDQAPDAVGLAQYPDGKDYYRHLVRVHTTMDLTPEEIHQLGLRRVAELAEAMAVIRRKLGFQGTRDEFHQLLRRDPRFLAEKPKDVEDHFNHYIRRVEPIVSSYFKRLPKAPYGVERLAEEVEKGMTFGYYGAPTADRPKGIYYYNGSDLGNRSLLTAASLIYHELVPGHHFQIATQNENAAMHSFRRKYWTTVFSEGWAEYAAGLGFEMGLYDDPYDHYGRLIMEIFLATRLVVDTGMNYFGWSLKEARTFMRENLFQSDVEIASESLRYSTSTPGQALAYRIGSEKFWELRHRAEKSLGEDFDIKVFHDLLLSHGDRPMGIVDRQVDRWIGQQE